MKEVTDVNTRHFVICMLLFLSLLASATMARPGSKEEQYRQLDAKIRARLAIVKNPVVQSEVERIVINLAQASGREDMTYCVRVFNGKGQEIAACLPDGYFYISVELLHALNTDDELAFVFAHEMIHCLEEHGEGKARRAQRINTIASIAGTANEILGYLASLWGAAKIARNSRKAEDEADKLAYALCEKAGYSSMGGLGVLGHFMEESMGMSKSVFASHHDSGTRFWRRFDEVAAPALANKPYAVMVIRAYPRKGEPGKYDVMAIGLNNKRLPAGTFCRVSRGEKFVGEGRFSSSKVFDLSSGEIRPGDILIGH